MPRYARLNRLSAHRRAGIKGLTSLAVGHYFQYLASLINLRTRSDSSLDVFDLGVANLYCSTPGG